MLYEESEDLIMGMDIHDYIINRDGEYVKEDMFGGRNSEWFQNIQGDGWDDVYDSLPITYGIPDKVPMNLQEAYDKQREWGYFGFYYMTVGDFKDWFVKKRPDIDAGWLSTYEEWQYKTKGVIPNDFRHYLDDDCNPADYHFVEITNPYDCSAWFYHYLIDNNIPDEDYWCYFFDC